MAIGRTGVLHRAIRQCCALFPPHRPNEARCANLWHHVPSRGIAADVARSARQRPELALILILPAAPEELAFGLSSEADSRFGEWLQARCVDKVARAFGRRALIVAPAVPRRAAPEDGPERAVLHGAPIVYVHAKVSVFDGATAIVSSANLNGRSLRWDTEAGVRLDDPVDAAHLERRLMAHWMGEDGPRREGESGIDLVARWRRRIGADLHTRPEDRRGFLLPYPLRAAREAGQYLPGIPDEMV